MVFADVAYFDLRVHTIGLISYAINLQKKQYYFLEKYFSVLLIYQPFGYNFWQNPIDFIVDNNSALDFALIINNPLIDMQKLKKKILISPKK